MPDWVAEAARNLDDANQLRAENDLLKLAFRRIAQIIVEINSDLWEQRSTGL